MLSGMAGSYVESASDGGSDKQDSEYNHDKDFRFLDFLKTSSSNTRYCERARVRCDGFVDWWLFFSSAQSRSDTPKLPSSEVAHNDSDESSLSMLDLDQIAGTVLQIAIASGTTA